MSTTLSSLAEDGQVNVPCVYRFRWDACRSWLILSIREPEFIAVDFQAMNNISLVRIIARYNHLDDFLVSDIHLGFLDCFEIINPEYTGYLSWKANLSQDDADSRKRLRAIVATLHLITWLLNCHSPHTHMPSDDQLMVVSLSTAYGYHDNYINALITSQMANWLQNSFSSPMNKVITEAMLGVWDTMYPGKTRNYSRALIESLISPPQVILNVGEQATRIHTVINDDNRMIGDHNVDTPEEILTLLVGLSTLCDLARE